MGARIQKARLAAGLTQEKFGELVGLSAKNISMIECGVSGISVPTLRRICRVLSISSDDILVRPGTAKFGAGAGAPAGTFAGQPI